MSTQSVTNSTNIETNSTTIETFSTQIETNSTNLSTILDEIPTGLFDAVAAYWNENRNSLNVTVTTDADTRKFNINVSDLAATLSTNASDSLND